MSTTKIEQKYKNYKPIKVYKIQTQKKIKLQIPPPPKYNTQKYYCDVSVLSQYPHTNVSNGN